MLLTISGGNFGATGTGGVVTVAGKPCTYSATQWDHTRVLCNLPSGSGYQVKVNLTVGGQSAVSNFAYAPLVSGITGGPFVTGGNVKATIAGRKLFAHSCSESCFVTCQ